MDPCIERDLAERSSKQLGLVTRTQLRTLGIDRFARADPARTRAHGGVGLGLAIVDAIAKAHGGRCTVRNANTGATFSLRLPRFKQTAVAAEPQPLRNS